MKVFNESFENFMIPKVSYSLSVHAMSKKNETECKNRKLMKIIKTKNIIRLCHTLVSVFMPYKLNIF